MIIFKFFAAIFAAVGSITVGYTLTIDNQLVIIANDCYTRIAIGSVLPSKEIAASVIAATVTECEDECSRERITCEIFSFGISSKGNATCLLGTRVPNAEELMPNPDYDVYIRQQSSPHCMPDRLYKLGSGSRNPTNYDTDNEDEEKNPSNDTERGPKPGKRPVIVQSAVPRPGGLGTVEVPNAEKVPDGGGDRNHPNYPTYQVAEVVPNFPPSYAQPVPIFDDDNPNGRPSSNYGDKNNYGIVEIGYGTISQGNHKLQGSHDFGAGYRQPPFNPPDFYHPGEYGIDYGNEDDHYSHGVTVSGNHRYGINLYDTPDTVCKLSHDLSGTFVLVM